MSLLYPERLTCHVQQESLVAQPVHADGAEDLVLYDLLPSCKRQVGRDYSGSDPGPHRDVVKKHFRPFLVKADITHFVADDKVKLPEAGFKNPSYICRLCYQDNDRLRLP